MHSLPSFFSLSLSFFFFHSLHRPSFYLFFGCAYFFFACPCVYIVAFCIERCVEKEVVVCVASVCKCVRLCMCRGSLFILFLLFKKVIIITRALYLFFIYSPIYIKCVTSNNDNFYHIKNTNNEKNNIIICKRRMK